MNKEANDLEVQCVQRNVFVHGVYGVRAVHRILTESLVSGNKKEKISKDYSIPKSFKA